MLVVIGPDWLRVTDEWGRRRIDYPEDWVRAHCEAALDRLIDLVAGQAGLQRLQADGRFPNGPRARPAPGQGQRQPLDDEQVRARLHAWPGWQLGWSLHPCGLNRRAKVLRRVYDFPSFLFALALMGRVARAIDGWRPPHHPRRQNQ